jgi:Na+/H+-dicarboxylate symporter
MSMPAAAAAEDRPRRRLYTQLWFWVLVAIAAGVVFGLVVPDVQAFGGTFFTAESIAVGIALVVGIDRIMSEGRALTNCIGNGVATMVVAKWQGERDDERFQAALRNPRIVEEATERALRGEEVETGERFGGRFERDRERAGDLVLPS